MSTAAVGFSVSLRFFHSSTFPWSSNESRDWMPGTLCSQNESRVQFSQWGAIHRVCTAHGGGGGGGGSVAFGGLKTAGL